ncbi:hypothetical protein Daesc_003083 [Daldinia eschscholtzii]|uniref:Uncharacterized protein n=1 Tax=Daldinia eschscholtzii TaxID=292717 RepID=A0AAX6MS46_9PEZI
MFKQAQVSAHLAPTQLWELHLTAGREIHWKENPVRRLFLITGSEGWKEARRPLNIMVQSLSIIGIIFWYRLPKEPPGVNDNQLCRL